MVARGSTTIGMADEPQDCPGVGTQDSVEVLAVGTATDVPVTTGGGWRLVAEYYDRIYDETSTGGCCGTLHRYRCPNCIVFAAGIRETGCDESVFNCR